MSYSDEHVALCALNKIFGYHPALAVSLLEQADSPLDLFNGSLASLRADGDIFPFAKKIADVRGKTPPPDTKEDTTSFAGGDTFSVAKNWADAPEKVSPSGQTASASLLSQLVPSELEWARKELERVEAGGFRFITLNDVDYPAALREIPDPPLGLYLNGTSSPTEIFGWRPMIGIVGTRDISPYGREWCRKIVEALAAAPVQPCIVSGLAFGADGIAHKTALDCGLGTVGVMATGIEQVYPWQHRDLAMSMVRSPGSGVLTDYPMDTSPVAHNFLRRNRIIAGLCSAVIVVESKNKGGSLVTAKYAVDYDREVFALPGRIDDPRSAGCNSLIASNMAHIITSPEELVGQLGLGGRVRGAGGSWAMGWTEARFRQYMEKNFGAGSAMVAVGMAVREHRGARAEDLAACTGLPFGTVMESVGLLEAHGIITTDLLRRCTLAPAYT